MDQVRQLELYKENLLRWGAVVNVAGPDAMVRVDEHISEALLGAELVKPFGRILDFGSGGGLPAIPMAIMSPDARFELVEADQRKWAFLKHVIRECALSCLAHGVRLANFVGGLGVQDQFDMITSRAVGRPNEWLPLILPNLREGGRVVLFSGAEDLDLQQLKLLKRHTLPRREANFLYEYQKFHVEQYG